MERNCKKQLKENSAKQALFLLLEYLTKMTSTELVRKDILKGRRHLKNKFSSFFYNQTKP